MARLDEQKPVNDENVEPVSDEPRKGDVLGLSGSDVEETRCFENPIRNQLPSGPKARVSVTSSDLRRRVKN